MATNEQAQAKGFATPDGTTSWRTGDDHIAQNARAAVELFQAYQAYVNDLSGIETPDAAVALLAEDEASAFRQALDPVLAATFARRGTAFEMVPFTIYGHSWGSSGTNLVTGLGSTFFERVASRLRTKTVTNNAQSGTRMDEILARIKATWTINTRGLIGFAEGIANDVGQNASGSDATAKVQVAETLRTCLAWLSARAQVGGSSISYGAGWTAGTTTTVGSYVDVGVNGDAVDLLFTAVTGAGGTFTITNGGTTLATVTTGGYFRSFTLSKRITGLGAGDHTLRITLTAGTTGTFEGGLIPSPTPPLIVWAKCGPRNYGAGDDARMADYQATAQLVADAFTNVVTVAVDNRYDKTLMLDQSHPNDLGNAYYADIVQDAIDGTDFHQGLNALTGSGSAAGSYVGPILVPTYAADTFTRANTSGGPGVTETGAKTWSVKGSGNVVEVVGNDLRFVTIGTAPQDCTIDDGQADGTLQATILVGGSIGGISFRQDATSANGYLFYNNGSNWSLRKRTAGGIAVIATGTAVAATTGDVITVILNGSSITCKVNGVTQVTSTQTDYQTNTHHGFYSTSAGQRFDNFTHTAAVV